MHIFKPQRATLVFFSLLGFLIALMGAWFAQEPHISQFFAQWYFLQQNPAWWLQIPSETWQILLAPTVILMAISQVVIKISPQPKSWSRAIVVGILLALIIRYLLWRSLCTLNLVSPVSGMLSLGLWLMELLVLTASIIPLYLMLKIKDRKLEADQKSIAVIQGIFTPSVDVLIPTYNEPIFIIRRTIIGCQALNYQHKKIYVLDDGNRLEVKYLTQQLGCEYLSRSDNRYAKAGNLNHALTQTQGDLIAVFDADFIPTQNFLHRTIGFFQDQTVGLVQTPQSFYNSDPIAKNLGVESIFLPDEEIFYRQAELIKDGAGSPVCSGTSFVVRRTALEEIGGFVTDSISEDYFTGICLSAKGYRLVYLNEKLSAGLAAENMVAYYIQRQRWGRGTLQAFFIPANPLTIPGLTFTQRLAHLEGLLHWFSIIPSIYFLLMPMVYAFFGIFPLTTTTAEWLYFFLPYYLVQITVFSWLNYRSRSALISGFYQYILCIPLAVMVLKTIVNPFEHKFQVTAKGLTRNQMIFNWKLACPLLILWGMNFLSILRFLLMGVPIKMPVNTQNFNLGLIWSIYNLIMLSIALFSLVDVPQVEALEWYSLRRIVKIKTNQKTYWGITTAMSEVGCDIQLNYSDFFNLVSHCFQEESSKKTLRTLSDSRLNPSLNSGSILLDSKLKMNNLPTLKSTLINLNLKILDEDFYLKGTLILKEVDQDCLTVKVRFTEMDLTTYRRLIELLFCRPGQWQSPETIGELESILVLLKIFFKPPFLFPKKKPFIIPVS